MIKVFVGYDGRQDYSQTLKAGDNPPYRVCKRSIRQFNNEVKIIPLKLSSLIELGLYYREVDPLASTEFTYSRFLVPYLSDYKGVSIFCDSDFLWNCNVEELLEFYDESNAVTCVKHDYTPSEATKMDGCQQAVYPRKNWSSLMMFNCAHEACRNLSVENVNTLSAKYLHRMEWVNDNNIGELPLTYNFLEGDYIPPAVVPQVIHYTNGGPWHNTWNGSYRENWMNIFNKL